MNREDTLWVIRNGIIQPALPSAPISLPKYAGASQLFLVVNTDGSLGTSSGGGGGTPAGVTGDVQINTSGAFDVDSGNYWYDKANHNLSVLGTTFGSEKVINGTFTGSAAGWNLNTVFTYSSNSVSKTADGTVNMNNLGVWTDGLPIVGLTYQLSITVSALTAGSIVISTCGVTLPTISANGTYTFTFVCVDVSSSNGFILITPTNTARLTVDNVSVKRRSGGSLTAGDSISSKTFTATLEGLATTPTDGYFLRNITKATSGSQIQASPALHYQGQGWLTNSSASTPIDFDTYLLPAAGLTALGSLITRVSPNGGVSWTNLQTLKEDGTFTNFGGVVVNFSGATDVPQDGLNHITLTNPSTNGSAIGVKFGSSYKSGLGFDSGGTVLFFSANGNYDFFDGVPGSMQNQIFNGGYYSTGGGFFQGSVSAGSNNISPSSKLTAYGRTGTKVEVITASTTLSNSNGTILTDATNAHSCTGSPTYGCSHWTNSTDCGTNDSHGGCTWTGGLSCNTYNGDQAGCQATSGCTYDSSSCSAFNNDSGACTAQSGCSYPGNLGNCASFTDMVSCSNQSPCLWTEDSINCTVFNGNNSACISQTGCSVASGNSCPGFTNDADCSGNGCTPVDSGDCGTLSDGGGDGTLCATQPSCSYDPGSGTCSGSFFTSCIGDNSTCSGMYDPGTGSCSGNYDDGSCTGSYYTGNCSGTYGNCSGSSQCAPISNSSYCSAEGCTWSSQLSVTLDPETTSPFVFYAAHDIMDISSSGSTVLYPNSGQSIFKDASNASLSSLTITNKALRVEYFAYPGNCATDFGDQGSCEAHSGCSDVFGNCNQYSDGGGDGTACASAPFSCSYDSSSGNCSGSPWIGCSGTYAVSKKWYVTSLK